MTTEPIQFIVDGEPIAYDKCPLHGEAMRRYMEFRCDPGYGIKAILRNDLFTAITYCDAETQRNLEGIVKWLHNNAPPSAFGSDAKVEEWLNGGRNPHIAQPLRGIVNAISGGDVA